MTMFMILAGLGIALIAGAWILLVVLRAGMRRNPKERDANADLLAALGPESQFCLDPALLTDASGTILYASESALARLGYSAARLQGAQLMDLAVSPETLEASWRLMEVLGRKSREFNIELKRGDDVSMKVALTVTRLSQSAGGVNLVTLNSREAGGRKCLPCATGERLRMLLDQAPSAIYEADAEGRLTYFNGRFAELHSMQERIHGLGSVFEAVHPEDREFVVALWREAIRETREFSTEHRVLNGDQRERWITLQGKPLRAVSGEIRMVGGAWDTSSVHQALAAARRADSLMDSIVHSTPVPIFVLDKDARVTVWNPAAQALFGFSAEEVIGGPNPVVAERDRREFEGSFARVMAGEVLAAQRVTRTTREGHRVEVSLYATPVLDEEGRVSGVAACLMDVSAHVAAERELQLRALDLRRSQEIANLGSWYFDFTPDSDGTDGRLQWSSQTYRIFGVDEGTFEVSMARFLELVHPDDRQGLMAAARRAVSKGVEYRFDHRIIRPDGETRLVSERACLERSGDGQLLRLVGTIQDVTEQRQLEQRLAQADRMEGIGRLAGGVAHDFNNLLTVINGYCDLLLEGSGRNESYLRPVREIRKAGTRAAELTNQLLAFGRRQVTQPRLVDLNTAANEAAGMLGRLLGEDIALSLELTDQPIRTWIDPTQINQVLMNLAINARDAMPWGGRLTIRTSLNRVPEQLELYEERKLCCAVLEVEDTGEGMEACVLAHIFEPFFTTKTEGRGSGLGLPMVYGIVKQAGGDIQVSSEPGQGTRFTIYLPTGEESEASACEIVQPVSDVKGGNETVLIVEDQADVLEIAAMALRGKGYSILEAQSPGEAFSICESHEGPIHLILTDIVLPGMSGLEMSRLLAVHRPEAKLVFMSGYAREKVAERGILPADTEYMAKPFTIHEIQSRVRRVLDAPQMVAGTKGAR